MEVATAAFGDRIFSTQSHLGKDITRKHKDSGKRLVRDRSGHCVTQPSGIKSVRHERVSDLTERRCGLHNIIKVGDMVST